LLAAVSRTDAWHARVERWWLANREPVLVPVTVVPEVCHLIATRLGAAYEVEFVRALVDGDPAVEPLADADLSRVVELMDAYADLPLGFVDATIVALAERLGIATILTTDRRHFAVVRPAHVPRLTLVP
jgi:hypothetical protein